MANTLSHSQLTKSVKAYLDARGAGALVDIIVAARGVGAPVDIIVATRGTFVVVLLPHAHMHTSK